MQVLHVLKFQTKHEKSYANAEEEAKRFAIFQETAKRIAEHNKRYEAGEVTYRQGINEFADLTREEFKKNYLGCRQ